MTISPALARLAFIIAVIALWEVFARTSGVSPILIAPPSRVAAQLLQMFANTSSVPNFYPQMWVTIQELVVAFSITAVFGVLIGFLFASSRLLGDTFEPILLGLYAIPKIILYPLVVLMLGIGMIPKIVFGVMVGIFVVIFNTAAGLRQVEPNYTRLARSLGYGKWMTFFKVVVPAAAPTILAGQRLGFGYTIIGVLAAELLVVNQGLGSLIDWASFNYATPELYALIIVSLAIGALGNGIFSVLERRWVK